MRLGRLQLHYSCESENSGNLRKSMGDAVLTILDPGLRRGDESVERSGSEKGNCALDESGAA